MPKKAYIYNCRSFDESEIKEIKSLIGGIRKLVHKNSSTIMRDALEYYKKSFQGEV